MQISASKGNSELVQGVGVDGCNLLPSPSGINMLPESQQAAAFVGSFAALAAGTALLTTLFDSLTLEFELFQSCRYTWPLLGVVYLAAGVTHFTLEDEYVNIYPSYGAWGFWKLPGSAKFHVQWTGVAEILGGIGLLIGGAFDAFAPVFTESPNVLTSAGIESDSAFALFILTLAVTPANIFMWTHGARLPTSGPEIPVAGHYARGVMQIVLLAILYEMGAGTVSELFGS